MVSIAHVLSTLQRQDSNVLGAYGQDPQNPLHEMQEAHCSQGDSVQKGQGLQARPRKEAIRYEAEGIRWSDQTHLQKEGQADQEGHS